MNWSTLTVSVKIHTPIGLIKVNGYELAALADLRLPGETPAQTYIRVNYY